MPCALALASRRSELLLRLLRHANPLRAYFGHIELLLAATGGSYRDGSGCHLDLVQWATDPLWARIPDARTRARLLLDDASFLRRQLADTGLRLVLVNGGGAVRKVTALGASWHDAVEQPLGRHRAWLQRGTLEGVALIGWGPHLPKATSARRAAKRSSRASLGRRSVKP